METRSWAAACQMSMEISKATGRPPRFRMRSDDKSTPDFTVKTYGNVRTPPTAMVVAKCVHLGITVPNTSGGCRTTHVCDNGHGHVRPCVECRGCKDFQSEDSDE